MSLQKLTFKPGVNRENTRYTNEGQWWDMDKIRFRSGTPEKIGGWTPLSSTTFIGTARLMHNWVTIAGENLMAVGTNLKMYLERSGIYWDITPVRLQSGAGTNPATVANPIATTSGSATIRITYAGHTALTGDYVTISGATGFNGISSASLNREFVVTVISTSIFDVTTDTVASGSGAGGGIAGAVVLAFQVNTGSSLSIIGLGYGVGAYGVDPYGSPSSTSPGRITTGLRQWVGDNFGQDFIFNIRDGGVYYWSAQAGAPASLAVRGTALSAQAGASYTPTIASLVFVTDDQHVVACGANALGSLTQDPLLVRWCDQGNPINWAPSIATTAGDNRLTNGSYIIASEKMRQENLLWTDTALVSMQFVGPPVVFSFTTIATNISIVSPTAVGVAANTAYWMGRDKFYVYNGQVQTLPCDVRKYVFGSINRTQMGQVFTGTNAQFNEITWYYPSAASDSPDRYVTYNYLENIWTFGTMSRSAWSDSPLRDSPMAAGLDGKLYYHEHGMDDGSTTPASALPAYLESSDFDIGDGDNFSFVSRIIPDVDFDGSTATVPAVTLTLKARESAGGDFGQTYASGVAQTAVVPFQQFTEYCYVRLRGRQMVFRIESTALGVTWQLGTPRLDLREDGSR